MLAIRVLVVLMVTACCVCFTACNKTPITVGQININQVWEIDSDFTLSYRDAAIYDDYYLVWGSDINDNPLLLAYDINTRTQSWGFDFSNISGWGTKLNVTDNYLVVKDTERGITVIDLDLRQTIAAIRFAQDYPGWEASDTPIAIEDNKVFFTLSKPDDYLSQILSINLQSGNITSELVLESDDFMIPRITTPSFYVDNNNQPNSMITVQLMRTNLSMARTSATLIMSLDEDFDTNWLDTIHYENGTHPIKWLPVVKEDIMVTTFIDDLIAYNVITGQKLLEQELPKASGSKLVLNEDNVYYAFGQRRAIQKLDISNGTPMWEVGATPAPSDFGDFLVESDYVVYVRESFGKLTVIDNLSGANYQVGNQVTDGIANPAHSDKHEVYISHQENKVIGFTLEED